MHPSYCSSLISFLALLATMWVQISNRIIPMERTTANIPPPSTKAVTLVVARITMVAITTTTSPIICRMFKIIQIRIAVLKRGEKNIDIQCMNLTPHGKQEAEPVYVKKRVNFLSQCSIWILNKKI